ncbi:MAG: Uma2 family endonuclease [Armatimonadetes bacterium]|nr:Uma2 family endonuclease [Armatimonadota bacterium]
MALPQRYIEKDRYTEDEYFEIEQNAFGRWEYVDGEIRAMSGGTDEHSAIASNIVTALTVALRGAGRRTCRVFNSDLKVHTGDGINTYPDVSVVCGPRVYHRGRRDVITNPLLIVEVLSDSTEGYDRGEKFDHYGTIPTLADYLLAAQDEARVLLYTRQPDRWDLRAVSGLANSIYLPSVDVTLALSDIYDLSEFEAEDKTR